MPSARQNIVALAVAAALLLSLGWQYVRTAGLDVEAGFWFEAVTYGPREAMAARLGGPLTPDELRRITHVAREEVRAAFRDLRVAVSDSREARYRVRVVQELRNAMRPRVPGPAGESRSLSGLGGQGAVSFRSLVSSAVAHAPDGALRVDIVDAIGRGVGRTAVHEFAHQLLGSAPIDSSRDAASYEFRSADRPEHFYGSLHWSNAGPLLQRRFGR